MIELLNLLHRVGGKKGLFLQHVVNSEASLFKLYGLVIIEPWVVLIYGREPVEVLKGQRSRELRDLYIS